MTGDPVVEIDLDDPTPPYAQLRRGLAALIEQGTLAGGQRLPTVRQLAGDLGIAAGTVMRAYKELESAGYVRGDRRRGTVVIPRERDPVVVDAALRALAVAYRQRAEDLGATPEQTLAAVSRVLADDHTAVVTRAGALPARFFRGPCAGTGLQAPCLD